MLRKLSMPAVDKRCPASPLISAPRAPRASRSGGRFHIFPIVPRPGSADPPERPLFPAPGEKQKWLWAVGLVCCTLHAPAAPLSDDKQPHPFIQPPQAQTQDPSKHPLINSDQECCELLVKFREGTSQAARDSTLAPLAKTQRHYAKRNIRPNGKRGHPFFDQLVSAQLKDNIELEQALRTLRAKRFVEYAELNARVSVASTIPNEPSFPALWGLDNTGQTGGTPDADIDLPEAWDLGTGSHDVVVAVIDTGIDYTHPDLSDNIWINPNEIPSNGIDDDGNGIVDDIHGANFITRTGDPLDDHFHGTHCAGTIGAVGNNTLGVAGINWNVRLMALKFLGSGGSGSTADAIAAIQYAINNGAHVLSNSWGSSLYLQSLQDAITAAYEANILVVAAAGNSNTDQPFYPAAYEHVLAVAATDHNDNKASFSNFGSHIDVAAPGVNIYSTFPTYTTPAMGSYSTEYESISGTSMACPHVAGLGALLLGRNASLTVDDLQTTIESHADDRGEPGFDLVYGWGRINAQLAMSAVENSGTPLYPDFDITSPSYGEKAFGVIDITGTASGETFSSYLLERSDNATGWVNITTSSTPVIEGTLGQWDSLHTLDGRVGLRLTVEDQSGANFYDYIELEVNNIEAELGTTNKPGAAHPLEIFGSADVNSGAFSRYVIEYGEGLAPREWNTDGILLANDGSLPVRDGILGALDTSGLTPGYYVLRLTVQSSLSSEVVNHEVYVDPDLLAGFPTTTPGSLYGAIGIGDLLEDSPAKEILLSTSRGTKIVANDASHIVTLDSDILYAEPRLVQPNGTAIGELSSLPGLEYAYFFKDWARLHAANGGDYLLDYPVNLLSRDVSHSYESQGTTMLYDIDNDRALDIVVPTVSYWDGMVYLNALDSTGLEVAGFPFSYPYPSAYTMRAGAVGDLDGDGRAEIFFTAQESPSVSYDFTRATLFGVDDEGRLLPDFPIEFLPLASGTIDLGDLQIADLNGDGQKELIFVETSSASQSGLYRFAVHALEKNGQELDGWPFALEGAISDVGYAVPEKGGTLAVGDVDGDGTPEVAAMPNLGASGSIYWGGTHMRILAASGEQLRSISNIHTNEFGVLSVAKPAGLYIADVNGDGRGELVTTRYITLGPAENKVSALAVLAYADARIVGQWVATPLFDSATGASYVPQPGKGVGLAIDDVDGDGTLEITYAADAYRTSAPGLLTDTVLYAWDLGVPQDPSALSWPITGGSIARTGEYSGASQPVGYPRAQAAADQSVMDVDGDGFESVTLDASNSFDPDGTIVSYDWSENGLLIANGMAPSVRFGLGTHQIKLTVTDNDLLTGSDEVMITVKKPNTPPIADAGDDQELIDTDGSGTETVTLNGAASYDPDGTIVGYEWWENGALIASGAMPQVHLPLGPHELTLIVRDDGSPALTASDQVTVMVSDIADTTPPSVAITNPTDGDAVSRKSTVTVRVAASDDSSSVRAVEIFINGELRLTDTAPPFEYPWNVPGANNKLYRLEAKAYDAEGNVGVSEAVEVLAH